MSGNYYKETDMGGQTSELKYKLKYCGTLLIYFICISLFLISFLFNGGRFDGMLQTAKSECIVEKIILYFFVYFGLTLTLCVRCFLIYTIQTEFSDALKEFLIFIYGICLIGFIPLGVMSWLYVWGKRGILLFTSCMCQTFGSLISLLIQLLILNVYKNKYDEIKKIFPVYRRILEFLFQIILLPLSIIVQAFGLAIYIGGPFIGGFIIKYFFYCGLKQENSESGYSYNVGASDKIVTTTQTHDIKNYYGKIVGTYETTDSHIEHDSGDRHEFSDQYYCACWNSVVALPCRIISLMLSAIAIFVPNLCISVAKTKNIKINNLMIFRFLDIV